jgi:hypothetical protein
MSEPYFNLTSFLTSLSQEELLVYERTKRFLKLEKKLFNTILTQPKVELIFNFSTQDGIYSILALIEAMDSILNDLEFKIFNEISSDDLLTIFHNGKTLVIGIANYDQNSEIFSNIQLEIYEFLR